MAELLVLRDNPGSLEWLPGVLVGGAAVAAAALAASSVARVRRIALGAALALLLVAPVTWSAQTLGHATSGTFPAGGPDGMSMGGPGGGPGGAAFRGGPPPGFGGRRVPAAAGRPAAAGCSAATHAAGRDRPLHAGARRRHDRRVEPVGRLRRDHRDGCRHRGARRLLGPRERGQRELARRGGARRPDRVGLHGERRPRRWRRSRRGRRRRRAHGLVDGDGGGRVDLHPGRVLGVLRGERATTGTTSGGLYDCRGKAGALLGAGS